MQGLYGPNLEGTRLQNTLTDNTKRNPRATGKRRGPRRRGLATGRGVGSISSLMPQLDPLYLRRRGGQGFPEIDPTDFGGTEAEMKGSKYGGTSHDEMEVTIQLDRTDRQAYICSTWSDWSRKLERLFGCPTKETMHDGKITSAFWAVPLNRVSLRRGTSRAPLTEAQREAASQRMRQARERRALVRSPV